MKGEEKKGNQEIAGFFSQKIEKIIELYEDDRLGEAYSRLNELPDEIVKNSEIMMRIQQDYLETRALLNEFQDENDWISEKEGNIQVSYKKVPGTPTISLKCESVVQVPLFDFISLIYETELYPDWVPFCKTCRTVERINKSKKIIFCEFDVVRIAKRAACVVGYGHNLLHTDGFVMVVSKSVDYECKSKFTFAKLNFFGCLLRPLSENSVSVKLISNNDPKIYFLPYSLLNWAVRKMARLMFEKLTEKSKRFSQEHQDRMELPENQEFYQHLRRALQEYLNSTRVV
jgi:hypothetical protein